MDECWEQREKDLTDCLNTSSIIMLFWLYVHYILFIYVRARAHVCLCVCAKQMWGSRGKDDTPGGTLYSYCVCKTVAIWGFFLENMANMCSVQLI